MFRVTINDEKLNTGSKRLGDRVLNAWVGTQDKGILLFPTYSYSNLEGAGDSNVAKQIPHENRHLAWFFVYFGYSRSERRARVYVKFHEDEEE